MARFGFGWGRYVPVAERRAEAARLVARLRREGRTVEPVEIEGRKIARTFWGRAWCDNLETYGDHANRLPRGRRYARNGSVVDLQVAEGRVTALVSGSDVYEVTVTVSPAPAERWREVAGRCAGRIDSVVELLSGRLADGVMEVLASREGGLFPGRHELRPRCSCPDGARLCKHTAAALYGVGARLDRAPELLFVLRGVDAANLVAEAESTGALGAGDPAHGDALAPEGLSELFGIELDDADEEAPPAPAAPDRLWAALTRPTLLRLCAAFGLKLPPGYQRRARLEEALREDGAATADAVLAALKRTELQRACARLGLPTSGRRKAELAERIRSALGG